MKTNQDLTKLIVKLKKTKKPVWAKVAKILEKPKRKRHDVNVDHVSRHTKAGETAIVPGKLLGTGELRHSVNVAAYSFSKQALEKIEAAKGKSYSIEKLIEQNPTGKGVKVLE